MTDQDTKPSRAEQARINGAKSLGPITPEGKARSSRNALTHGFSAAINTVLTIEDIPAWELHIESYRNSFKPQCYVEYSLVDQLASINWRQCRLVALETTLMEAHLGLQNKAIEHVYPQYDSDPSFHMVLAWYGLARQPQKPPPPTSVPENQIPREGHDITSIELLRRYLTTLDRQYRNVQNTLRQFRKDFGETQSSSEKSAPKPAPAEPKEPTPEPVSSPPRSPQPVEKRPPTPAFKRVRSANPQETPPIRPASPAITR